MSFLADQQRDQPDECHVCGFGVIAGVERCSCARPDQSAQIELLREALEEIAEGGEPREVGKAWRADGKESKNDQCAHGVWMYESCGNCISEFARQALAAAKGDVG